MTDLTKITTPFGLLDKDIQRALKSHGGPYEHYGISGWDEIPRPSWAGHCVYRVMALPPKPREWWLVLNTNDNDVYAARHNEGVAKSLARSFDDEDVKVIHVREVMG